MYHAETIGTSYDDGLAEIDRLLGDLTVEPPAPACVITWLDGAPAPLPGVTIASPAPSNTAKPSNDDKPASLRPARRKSGLSRVRGGRRHNEESLRAIRRLERKLGIDQVARLGVANAPPSPHTPSLSPSPTSITPSTSGPSTQKPGKSRRRLVDWKRADENLRLHYEGRALEDMGETRLSFTLNMTPDRIARLLRQSAPAAFMLKEITRELGAALPAQALGGLWLALEVSETGRLHAHGQLAYPALTRRQRKKLVEALQAAGGAGYTGPGRQVDLHDQDATRGGQRVYKRDAWSGYSRKALGNTRRFLDEHGATGARTRKTPVIAASANVRALSRQLFEADRAATIAASNELAKGRKVEIPKGRSPDFAKSTGPEPGTVTLHLVESACPVPSFTAQRNSALTSSRYNVETAKGDECLPDPSPPRCALRGSQTVPSDFLRDHLLKRRLSKLSVICLLQAA